MPTTYNDQFYTFDPANPPPSGSAVNFVQYDLVDVDDDEEIDAPSGDTVNGSDVTNSWPGDTVTINVPGVGNVTYTGTTFYLADGSRVFTPTDGSVLQNGTFVSSTFVNTQGPLDVSEGGDLGPPCFTPGVRILTPLGDVAIETLKVGDLVETLDHGAQPIRWIGRRRVDGHGDFAPIRIAKGALGNDRALLVSPQHRFLAGNWRAELLFGEAQTLVAATHLVDGHNITVAPRAQVEYIHLMFDQHEVIFAESTPCESFHSTGDFARGDRAVMAELSALFADMPGQLGATARPVLRGFEARLLS